MRIISLPSAVSPRSSSVTADSSVWTDITRPERDREKAHRYR